MEDPDAFVEASSQLTSIFGVWPSFHDAEVHAINLWRGDVSPERDSWVAPVLTARIQVLEATQPGAQHAGVDTLVTLRFHGVEELRLVDFNHQNAIVGLSLTREFQAEGSPLYFRVRFERAFGIDASFRCTRIAVAGVERFPGTERRA